MKYVRQFLEEFKKTPVFTLDDAEKFLVYHGSTASYAKIFIKLMVNSGRAYKITKGFYTLYNDIEMAGFPFYPFYYGLGFALTKHRLWTQQANPYIITTRNVRRGVRESLGLNIAISRIAERMFFGYYYMKGANFYYPISNIEKTLIDCIYYRFNLEDYVYRNILERIDVNRLNGYLVKYDIRIRVKMTGILRRYGK